MNEAFARWLADATRGLAPADRERVRNEFIDHYSEALAAYQDRGYTADAAARAALDDLGDPMRTARAFAMVGRRPWSAARLGIEVSLGSRDGRVLVILVAYIALTAAILSQTGVDAILIAMQTASLALIVGTQLFFDDLDLSLGVLALIGTLVAQVPVSVNIVQPPIMAVVEPWEVYRSLVVAMLLGGAIGLLNGVLVVLSRRPAAYITLGMAIGLALLLHPFRVLHRSIWSVAPHWTAEILDGRPLLYHSQRTLITTLTVAVFAVVVCSMIVASRTSNDEFIEHAGSEGQRWRRRTLVVLGATLFPFVVFLGTLNRATANNPFVLVFAAVVCHALVIVIDELAHSPARRWFTKSAIISQDRRSNSLARIARFGACGALAALVGALITAHGMRDNTYRFAAAFLVIVPLAAVLVGGQHTLRRPYRVLSGIVGSLLVAALTAWPDDYKLNDDSVLAVLLAAAGVLIWRWAMRPQKRASNADTITQPAAPHVDLDIA